MLNYQTNLEKQSPTKMMQLKKQSLTKKQLKKQSPTIKQLKKQSPTIKQLKKQFPIKMQLKKQPPTNKQLKKQFPTKLKEPPITTNPIIKLGRLLTFKKLHTTSPITQQEEQLKLRVFLLFHIFPRRFFSQPWLPSKCLLFGQPTTNRRRILHPHFSK